MPRRKDLYMDKWSRDDHRSKSSYVTVTLNLVKSLRRECKTTIEDYQIKRLLC